MKYEGMRANGKKDGKYDTPYSCSQNSTSIRLAFLWTLLILECSLQYGINWLILELFKFVALNSFCPITSTANRKITSCSRYSLPLHKLSFYHISNLSRATWNQFILIDTLRDISNIILTSMLVSPTWSLLLRFSNQTLLYIYFPYVITCCA